MADQVDHDDGQGQDESGTEHREAHFRAREGSFGCAGHQKGPFRARDTLPTGCTYQFCTTEAEGGTEGYRAPPPR